MTSLFMVTTQNLRHMSLCITYQVTNTNQIIQRKPAHKNTKKLTVLRATKLSTKSIHSTAKDSYKLPQHTSKYRFEIPHRNSI